MTSKFKEYSNIRTFRKRNNQFNIGLLIFGILFLYLIVTVFTYVTRTHITRYEVREGSILKDNTHSGLILREEMLVDAAESGYLNYYIAEGSKVGVGSNIYVLSDAEIEQAADAAADSAGPSSEEMTQILLNTQKYVENYNPNRFAETYNLKNGIDNILQNSSALGKQAHLDDLLVSGTVPGLRMFQTPKDGIAEFSRDGFETLTADQVTLDQLNKKDYLKEEFTNNQKVNAGDPVYKLITSETWTIVTQLSPETAKVFLEQKKKNVQIRMLNDNEKLWAGIRIEKKSDAYIAFLTLDNSMVRYASERYVDFELIMEDQSGLKIPKSAAAKKSFYIVPTSYITQSGKGRESGVIREVNAQKGRTEFVAADVYFEDETEGVSYLDAELFRHGDVILEPESEDTYVIGEKRELTGVYNINKGYAVFKQIKILAESEEYYIIQSGSSYGLSNYDHIALHGDEVNEHDIVLE